MSCKGDGKPDRVGPGLVGGDTAVVVCSGLGAGFRIDLKPVNELGQYMWRRSSTWDRQ